MCLTGLIAATAWLNTSVAEETTSPIKHVVVIFQENVSFDHYFGTYPNALNPPDEPPFHATPGTPSVNGLNETLLTKNPNLLQPHRIDRSHVNTADQNHSYTAEQQAFDMGLMDKFVQFTGTPEGTGPTRVMDYYDGNVATALWNYAQHFAMSDNSYGTDFGPSTVGALNLISGNTHGVVKDVTGDTIDGTVIDDPQPTLDSATTRDHVQIVGTNIGDLLNAKNLTWGWFQGGFDNPNASHIGSDGNPKKDYIPHHEPFQYYAQTANKNHLPPTSVSAIGKTDQANHQYDITRFFQALDAGSLPAVSFLKAPGYQDGHAGYSDPLLEQEFLVNTINRIMESRFWRDTAIIIAYDDSDGWYDHVMSPIVNHSQTQLDALTGTGTAGTNPPLAGFQGRAGYGPRLPLTVISAFAKKNFVDHTITGQSSISASLRTIGILGGSGTVPLTIWRDRC